MSQSTVSAGGQSIGVAGQIADSMAGRDIVSGFSQDPAQMPFGYGVVKGSSVDGYLLPTGATGLIDLAGVNAFSLNHLPAQLNDPLGKNSGDIGSSGLLQFASLEVLRRGRVIVPVETPNPVNGDRAWCRFVATGSLTPGSWVGTNLNGSYLVDCRNQGVFRSNVYTAADGVTKVALLEVDFYGQGFARP